MRRFRYSNLFTGVHGNYLAPSIKAAGLDPNNLPQRCLSQPPPTFPFFLISFVLLFLFLLRNPLLSALLFVPISDPSKMNFGGDSAKAWKDIWCVHAAHRGGGAMTASTGDAARVLVLSAKCRELVTW